MNTPTTSLWQVNITGPFQALKAWADVRQDHDDPSWLALSVFEEALPAGRLQALFALEAEARRFENDCQIGDGFTLATTPLVNENWIAKSLEGLPVVHAGRFFVHGAHHSTPDTNGDTARNTAGIIPILIEAGEAFGTGHHGTTKGCLLAFDDILANTTPETVLDIGTGAGTLAIAAAKVLENADIVATDIDPVAITVTRNNAITNNVAGRLTTMVADGFTDKALQGRQFALVFANILAKPLMALAGDISAALAPASTLILSGILHPQSMDVRGAYEDQGLIFERAYALDEWRVLVMRKPT